MSRDPLVTLQDRLSSPMSRRSAIVKVGKVTAGVAALVAGFGTAAIAEAACSNSCCTGGCTHCPFCTSCGVCSGCTACSAFTKPSGCGNSTGCGNPWCWYCCIGGCLAAACDYDCGGCTHGGTSHTGCPCLCDEWSFACYFCIQC